MTFFACCPLYYIMTLQINQWITCIIVHVHHAKITYKECQCVKVELGKIHIRSMIIISHYSESVHKWQKTTPDFLNVNWDVDGIKKDETELWGLCSSWTV